MKSKYVILQIIAASILVLASAAVASASDTLTKAVRGDDLATVISELEAGASPDFQPAIGPNVLSLAAVRGKLEIVKALVEAGADIDALSMEGRDQRALSLAASSRRDNIEAIHYLIDQGADMEFKSGEFIKPPLQVAILSQQINKALAFIDRGADIMSVDRFGDSAIYGAVYHRQEVTLRALLEAGTDMTLKNNNGLNIYQFTKSMGYDDFAFPIMNEYHPDFCNQNPCSP